MSSRRKNRALAIGLAIIPGLIAIYGLGQMYLGKTRRGLEFLVLAALPFGLIGLSFLFPQIPWYASTIAWFTIYALQTSDALRLYKGSR